MLSQIEKILMGIEESQINIPTEEYKKQYDKLNKCKDALENRIKANEELLRLFLDYCLANEELQTVILAEYYKEGFIDGARVALEISGWKSPD